MSNHVYKKIELTGSSKVGVEDAVTTALHRASKSVRNMRWFELTELRGTVVDDKVDYWQVSLKVGFDVEE